MWEETQATWGRHTILFTYSNPKLRIERRTLERSGRKTTQCATVTHCHPPTWPVDQKNQLVTKSYRNKITDLATLLISKGSYYAKILFPSYKEGMPFFKIYLNIVNTVFKESKAHKFTHCLEWPIWLVLMILYDCRWESWYIEVLGSLPRTVPLLSTLTACLQQNAPSGSAIGH